MKTWGDIRSETLNLGFEKTKAYDKNRKAYVEAFNFAQNFIASEIGGLTTFIQISKDYSEDGEETVYDIRQMADGLGLDFITIDDVGVLDEYNKKAHNIAIVSNRFVKMPAEMSGDFKVYIDYLPRQITTESPDDTEVELPLKWANLMPYLMANRLYMDDDASISGYYWNLYDQMRNALLNKENTPVATIVGKIDIDSYVMEW